MSEKPLERLNYFNGQRLEAADLKTEQDYHIRTRRWLNKSLYTAGIVDGLEVRAVPGKPMVTVSPGLALDNEGREIILLEETPQEVISFAGTDATKVEGNYLVIEYGEETHGQSHGTCSSSNPAPSFIAAKPKFSWVPYIPHPGSNQIVLAQVELKPRCKEVEDINPNQRQIVRNASTASVRQYALEGEREVAFIPKDLFPKPEPYDPQNDPRMNVEVKGRIYFHIRGQQPNSVTLYLKAEKMSALHYTELGEHKHNTSGKTIIPDHILTPEKFKHIHGLSNVITDTEKDEDDFVPHVHDINARIAGPFNSEDGKSSIMLTRRETNMGWLAHYVSEYKNAASNHQIIMGGEHRHRLIKDGVLGSRVAAFTDTPKKDEQTFFPNIVLTHDSPTQQPTIDIAGVHFTSRNGVPLTHIDNLQVFIWRVENADLPSSNQNRTEKILEQLERYYPNWRQLTPDERKLGNGGAGHVFATRGTGAIQLNFLDNNLVFSEGEYCIEFRVKEGRADANGGKILYNLYIE